MNNGRVLSGAAEISEGFNTFFSNTGPQLKRISRTQQKNSLIIYQKKTDGNFILATMAPNIINDASSK